MTDQLIPTPPPPAPLQQLQPNTYMLNGALQGSIDPATMTAGGQLDKLMQSSSPLEQLAQSQGMNEAASRGSANGTLFAGASMAALNDKLQPIALNDANAYQKQQLENQNEYNQLKGVKEQAAAQTYSASVSAAASRYGADASKYNADVNAKTQAAALAQSHDEFNTNWTNQFQQMKDSQAFQSMSQDKQNAFAAKMTAFGNSVQTIFSDPSYWSDPQSAMGMLNYFNTNIDDLLAKMGIGP